MHLASAQSPLPLIPQPKQALIGKGDFTLDNDTRVFAEENSFEAKFLIDYIEKQYGIKLKKTSVMPKEDVPVIAFNLQIPDATNFDREYYTLEVNPKRIDISAAATNGQFYAVQSLIELLPTAKSKPFKIPCVQISDAPKFKWRGMHLDVCRHFFSVDFVKKYIDCLALYKFNTFHWHLTDDQGWRIEIKKYPKLTQIGGWRNGTMVGHYNEQRYDTIKYGGFYTQQQIKEVVDYAQERHITVVPEIEMPGHALAALSAYPELACTSGPFEAAKGWGVFDDVFCPKEETFSFLQNVLSEVMDLFPSAYIHIGGDECPKTRWKACAHCQGLIKELGLKDEHGLQSYFITRIEKYVNSKGRKIIGWDEILEGGLAPNAAVMSWRGTEGGTAAAKLNHNVVMSPGSHCYFDQYQADPKTQPLAIGGLITLEKVYSFNPVPEALSTEESQYILGAQANVWTEYMQTEDDVEYMVFPRISALAEVLWGTADPTRYDDFTNRLSLHLRLLDKWKVTYCKVPFKN
ncbi:beta-N-acetylglucosaminidase [Flavobacterium pallidum]|uniref:beta-N-acetylhexosaminidase n=2 Tax=Flavobacterium pallidum TaxID=2172098 RepID=A0A2S1SLC4_9FLAO|nr:beta-N-acetylglucosaminidase [Flavobacterium pallidum]